MRRSQHQLYKPCGRWYDQLLRASSSSAALVVFRFVWRKRRHQKAINCFSCHYTSCMFLMAPSNREHRPFNWVVLKISPHRQLDSCKISLSLTGCKLVSVDTTGGSVDVGHHVGPGQLSVVVSRKWSKTLGSITSTAEMTSEPLMLTKRSSVLPSLGVGFAIGWTRLYDVWVFMSWLSILHTPLPGQLKSLQITRCPGSASNSSSRSSNSVQNCPTVATYCDDVCVW